jgi:PAS domain S-box-containing protein
VKTTSNLKLILFFVALTVLLTLAVVFAWEELLMSPLYSYFEGLYPGPENADYRWKLSQRIEHFFISVVVDSIVVSLLLRIVNKQQRELRASEERYRALFEQAGDGIAVIKATDHRIMEVNKRFAEILGYEHESLVGRHICNMLEPGVDTLKIDSGSLEADCEQDDSAPLIKAWSGENEIAILTANDSPLSVSASCSMLSTDGEKLYTLIIRDLTERKRLEREKEQMHHQLFQTSKLASLGELSAGVAHEINNPLNCIINFAQLLKDDGVARNENEAYMVDGIIDEGERIAKIVRDLLTFARQGPSAPSRVALAEVINNSFSLFGQQLNKDRITVEIHVPETTYPVLADSSRLRQVVVNLISNAHHALREKQSDVKLFRVTASNVEGAARKVRLEFYDNGTGIKRENIEKVFDPFFTTRRDSGGTGLGLSFSFGIIHDYGGTISVESQEGSFTRFIIELPAVPEENYYADSPVGRRREKHPMDDGGAS